MIPQKPEILKAPLVVDGEKNILPETTPQGSNQFSLLGGFPTLTSLPVNAGGLPPKRLDFNAVFNLLSIHTFFLQSGNKYSWSSELDYSIGSTVLGSDNSVYFCIKANGATPPNTVQNPVTSTGYWVELVNSKGTVNIDLIADGAISTNKIANGAINTSKLADGAVTNDKISGVAASKVSGLATVAKTGSYNDLLNKPTYAPMPTSSIWRGVAGQSATPIPSYSLPQGGTYAYFISITTFIGYNAVENKVGVKAGGSLIFDSTLNVKTYGGLIWRIQ